MPCCVADPELTSALSTPESIVIDGANGVTTAPRAHFPDGVWFLALAVIVAVVVRLVKRPGIVAAVLVVAALPGVVHVLGLRGDAPLKRGAMAESIRVTLGDLQTRVPWPQSQVRVVREEDDVLFPLGRYALPSRNSGATIELELELGAGPLGQACRQVSQRVTCGAGP